MVKKIKTSSLWGVFFLPILLSATCHERVQYEISTGSTTGTYFEIGKNLAKYIAPDACIDLKVLSSNGSMDNINHLISVDYPNLKFAIVQNDVLQKLRKIAKEGKGKSQKNAQNLVNNLRVIRPLYNEEIYIITRRDSSINNFGDLEDKTIFIGEPNSGTAMTSRLLYKELFGKKLVKYKTAQPLKSDKKGDFFKRILKKLSHREIDAIIQVAGQPVKNLTEEYVPKASSKIIQLISYNEKNTKHKGIENYYITTIYAKNYPWLKENVSSLSTKAFLVTYKYKNSTTISKIKKFVEVLDKKLPILQREATKKDDTPHPKWKQVSNECNPPLRGGWLYHPVVKEACGNVPPPPPIEECTEDDEIMNLCKGK